MVDDSASEVSIDMPSSSSVAHQEGGLKKNNVFQTIKRGFRSPFRKSGVETSSQAPSERSEDDLDAMAPSFNVSGKLEDTLNTEDGSPSGRRVSFVKKTTTETPPEETPEKEDMEVVPSEQDMGYEDPDVERRGVPKNRVARRRSSTGTPSSDGGSPILSRRRSSAGSTTGPREKIQGRRRSLGAQNVESPCSRQNDDAHVNAVSELQSSKTRSSPERKKPVNSGSEGEDNLVSPRMIKRKTEVSRSKDSVEIVSPPGDANRKRSPASPSSRRTRKDICPDKSPRTPRRQKSSDSHDIGAVAMHRALTSPRTPTTTTKLDSGKEIETPSSVASEADLPEESKMERKLMNMKKKSTVEESDEPSISTRTTSNRVKVSKIAMRGDGLESRSVSAEFLSELAKKGRIRVKRTVSEDGVESFELVESPRRGLRDRKERAITPRRRALPESDSNPTTPIPSPQRRTRTPCRTRSRSIGRQPTQRTEIHDSDKPEKSPLNRSQSRGRRIIRQSPGAEIGTRTPRTPGRSRSKGAQMGRPGSFSSSSSNLPDAPELNGPSTPKHEARLPSTPTTTKNIKDELKESKLLANTPSPCRQKGLRSPSRSPRSPSDRNGKKSSKGSPDPKANSRSPRSPTSDDSDDEVVRIRPKYSASSDSLVAAQLTIPDDAKRTRTKMSVHYNDVSNIHGESIAHMEYRAD